MLDQVYNIIRIDLQLVQQIRVSAKMAGESQLDQRAFGNIFTLVNPSTKLQTIAAFPPRPCARAIKTLKNLTVHVMAFLWLCSKMQIFTLFTTEERI